MKICADFNNTITDNPEFFAGLHLLHDLIIVSGTSKDEHEFVEKFLKDHRIFYTELHLCPFTWKNPKEYHKAKEWKIKLIKRLKPDIYFDDSLREVLAVQEKSKTCGLLMVRSTYRKWMKRK